MENKRNKGYSLVELLIALAIFSLVLVGIVAILRTTSASYKNGLIEAQVQEEVQIASNQISDLLIDAKSIIRSTEPYELKGDDGKVFQLYYDSGDKTVNYNDVASGQTHILAKNVSDFSIKGMSVEVNADNKAEITLGITNGGASYKSTKSVTFRNDGEDNEFRDIEHVARYTGGSGGGSAGLVPILRYEDLNMSEQFDIVKNGVLSGDSQGFYTLVTEDNPHVKNAYMYTIKLNDTYKTNYDWGISQSYGITFSGTDSEGNNKTYKIYTDPVKFVADNPVLVFGTANTTNTGTLNYLEVEGININNYCKQTGNAIPYTVEVAEGSFKATGSNGKIEAKNIGDKMFPNVGQLDNGMQVQLGLTADPQSNGIWVAKDNPVPQSAFINQFTNKKATATFKITFNSKNYEIKYKFHLQNSTNLDEL